MAGSKKSPFIYGTTGVGLDARLEGRIELTVEEAQAAALADLVYQAKGISENLGAIANAVDRLATAVADHESGGASTEHAGTEIRDGLENVAASLDALAKKGVDR